MRSVARCAILSSFHSYSIEKRRSTKAIWSIYEASMFNYNSYSASFKLQPRCGHSIDIKHDVTPSTTELDVGLLARLSIQARTPFSHELRYSL